MPGRAIVQVVEKRSALKRLHMPWSIQMSFAGFVARLYAAFARMKFMA
jgi:hypothetical protein